MALGIPVMATRCTGPIELLEDGKAGLLVENSTEGIVEGLRKVLLQPETMSWLRSIDNTRRFNWRDIIRQIENLLDET